MKILVLDNYDSFVYNLVHMLLELGHETEVYRNDKISLEQVQAFSKILLSPGPGLPRDAGIMPELIQAYGGTKSILGICLGHQAIGEAYGAELHNLPEVLHGLSSENLVEEPTDRLFADLPISFKIGHYHSWVVKEDTLPSSLQVTSRDKHGNIMGLCHREYDVRGLQFHPESILTEYGKEMLINWLKA